MPTFVVPNDQAGQTPFGGKKFFWGNVPAFDIVDLANNEGKDFAGSLRLLFAGKMPATSHTKDAPTNN